MLDLARNVSLAVTSAMSCWLGLISMQEELLQAAAVTEEANSLKEDACGFDIYICMGLSN